MTLSINGHEVIPGAEWVTRGGFKVSIETVDMRADAPAVISGCAPDGKTFWYKDGHAYFGRDDEWDLIRPVAAPAEKKVEKPLNVAGGILTFLETLVAYTAPSFVNDTLHIETLRKAMNTIHEDTKAIRKACTPAPAEKKVEKPQPGSWVMFNGRKQYFVGPNDDGLCVLKADFGGFELAHPSTITPAPEKRKVQIAEFWTLHKKDGSITGSSVVGFNKDWINKDDVVIHHPAREIEVDDV